MKYLKFKEFVDFHQEEKLVKFINENNINQESILKLVYRTGSCTYVLFYYVEEE